VMQPATGSDQMTNSGAGGPGHVYRPALYLSFCGPVQLYSSWLPLVLSSHSQRGRGGVGQPRPISQINVLPGGFDH